MSSNQCYSLRKPSLKRVDSMVKDMLSIPVSLYKVEIQAVKSDISSMWLPSSTLFRACYISPRTYTLSYSHHTRC